MTETSLPPEDITLVVTPRRRVALLVLAAVVGALLATLAPPDWPEGSGTVVLAFDDETVVTEPVVIGSTEPITQQAASGSTRITLEFPGGLPADGAVEAAITVTRDGQAVQPDLDEVDLHLELPDGRVEVVPVTRWNEAEGRLEALRRPTQGSSVVLGLLGFVAVLWVSEALPLFVTSLLIPVVLVFSGIADATDAAAPFFNPIIVLFFAGFLMAEAMRRSALDHYVSAWITARAGRSAATLFVVMLAFTAFMSMWMSNTAATAVLVPIAIAVTAPLPQVGFRKALVLGIAYAATIGGVGSAIGTPANQLAIEFLDEFAGTTISFAGWFAYGIPMVVLFLPVLAVYLWRRSKVEVDVDAFRRAREVAQSELRRLGRPDRDQMVILVVFAVVAVGWLTQTFHGFHAGMVALAGAIVLFVLGKLLPEDLSNISWPSLLTFGGGLTLGLYLVETGTSDYLATRLVGLAGIPSIVAVLVVAMITLLLTTVASNTASAAILIPLAIPLAAVLGIDPTTLVVVVAIASSIDFALVIGTPPTMIAYSTRLYTAGQIFRTGVVLDLAGIALLVFAVTKLWELLGVT